MSDGPKRRAGRPRARKQAPSGPAKDAILLAAAELFTKQGYAGTSTREIADRVGIRQPSLFYHFQRKEDIMVAIINQAADVWIGYLPGFEKRPGSAATKLYELMRFNFLKIMTEPYGVGKLIMLPELRSGDFQELVESKRNRIISAYRKLIRRGIKEGDFEPCDVNVATHTVVGIAEAIWTWYRPARSKNPDKLTEQVVDLAMRALLSRPSQLDSIKKTAGFPQ